MVIEEEVLLTALNNGAAYSGTSISIEMETLKQQKEDFFDKHSLLLCSF